MFLVYAVATTAAISVAVFAECNADAFAIVGFAVPSNDWIQTERKLLSKVFVMR